MYLLNHPSTDCFFNLACEEYFVRHSQEDIILLWQNKNTIVVGKNQNTLEEINYPYVMKHNINVVRRMTGGGAVYHDLGNVNFSIIRTTEKEHFNDYAYFTQPVCLFLQTLGLNVKLSGRNDLTLCGMKFSGNAQACFGSRLLHHGTILFDSDLTGLSNALNPSPLKIESKGIKSVRSRVTNLRPSLSLDMTVHAFKKSLSSYLLHSIPDLQEHSLTPEEMTAIQLLAESKYRTWEWNYGGSPPFTLSKSQKYPFGLVTLRLYIESGQLRTLKIYGDFFGRKEAGILEKKLQNTNFCYEDVVNALEFINISDYIDGMDNTAFCSLLFQ